MSDELNNAYQHKNTAYENNILGVKIPLFIKFITDNITEIIPKIHVKTIKNIPKSQPE